MVGFDIKMEMAELSFYDAVAVGLTYFCFCFVEFNMKTGMADVLLT